MTVAILEPLCTPTDATSETIARLTRERDEARLALAEVLPFISDINNRESRGTTAWHIRHAATVETAAIQFGNAHMLSYSPHYTRQA